MKYVVNAEKMREIDQVTTADYGIEQGILMENAARAVVTEIMKHEPKKTVVFCGNGNNGGDGYVVARWLKVLGVPTACISMGGKASALAEQSRFGAEAFGVEIFSFSEKYSVSECVNGADLIVDALLGTGISREVEGDYLDCINLINRQRSFATVVAVDIPSGINSDDGRVMGGAVLAHETVTFAYPKYGHLLFPGREYVGKLTVAEICTHQNATLIDRMLEEKDIAELYAPRKANTHKGDYGKLAILGGTLSMEGSVQLAGMAALRTGAGLVTLGVPQSNYAMYAAKMPELMVQPLRTFDEGITEDVDTLCQHKDALVFGPGCKNSPYTGYILRHILHTYDMPIVIDADGLNALAEDMSILPKVNKAVLTPHYAEMARLLRCQVADVAEAPLYSATTLAQQTGAIVVLKGATTVISAPDGRNTFNLMGSPGMATAGSGDVLSGIIAALIATRKNLYQAVCLGVGLHGLAGMRAAETVGEHAMTAGDIIRSLGRDEKN